MKEYYNPIRVGDKVEIFKNSGISVIVSNFMLLMNLDRVAYKKVIRTQIVIINQFHNNFLLCIEMFLVVGRYTVFTGQTQEMPSFRVRPGPHSCQILFLNVKII